MKGPHNREHGRRKETEDAYRDAWIFTRVRLLCGEGDATGILDFVLLLFFFAFTPSEPVDWSELRDINF